MNISGMIRNLMGEAQVSEPKTLELKVGQVVKGMVTQSVSDTEAVLTIGGVQVRAQLETPLKQGEVTMLQVQPESSGGQVVLKPLQSSNVQIADPSLGEVLKTVGLEDTAANRQLVQGMHQAGVSLSKENVQAFAELMKSMPQGTQVKDVLPSAVIAFQKGLPLTPDTVNSIRQAVQGQPFHEVVEGLAKLVENELDGGGSMSLQSRALLENVKNLLQQVRAAGLVLSGAAEGGAVQPGTGAQAAPGGAGAAAGAGAQAAASAGAGAPAGAGAQAVPGGAGAAAGAGAQAVLGAGAQAMPGGAGAAAGAGAQAVPGGAGTAAGAGAQAVPGGAGAAAGAGAQAAPGGAGAAAGAGAQAVPGGAGAAAGAGAQAAPDGAGAAAGAGAQAVPGGAGAAAGAGAQAVPGGASAKVAGAGAQAVPGGAGAAAGAGAQVVPGGAGAAAGAGAQAAAGGANAAAQAVPGAEAQAAPADAQQGAPEGGPMLQRLMKALGVEHEQQAVRLLEPSVPGAAEAAEAPKAADSLKNALMQLAQSSEAPAALKEAAQQAVQQITGQQLMLSQDRTAMFSHITLFVPLLHPNGDQTAAVHIQSRKGKNGKLDEENCRLVFDLQMKSLGDTMVDVQVVNRIVSLHVLNDDPVMQTLLDSFKDEIAKGMEAIGYQFISMKVSPYPERTGAASAGDPGAASSSQSPMTADQRTSLYNRKPYKGVDIRL
ncbi:hypothetical protein [Paenibacillus mucilaginosus]|uniref:hypothetical protein n=1 Tax=Paenibacillus mucilaginosus TaxID=61624 RepID=UPI0023782663|nr:hypothetical protein [Paenibacillus mucilaginosus]